MSVLMGAPYACQNADASAIGSNSIRMTGRDLRGKGGRMPNPTKPLNAGYDPDRVREAIRAALDRIRSNPRALSILAGIDEGALRKFLSGRSRSPELETIMCLAAAAGMSTSEFVGEPLPASAPDAAITPEQTLELSRLLLTARQVQLQQSAQLDDVLAQLARLLGKPPRQPN